MSNKTHDDHQHDHKEKKGYSNKTRSTWVIYAVFIIFFVSIGFILIEKYGGSSSNASSRNQEEYSQPQPTKKQKKGKVTNEINQKKERIYKINVAKKINNGSASITMAVNGVYVLEFDESTLYDYKYKGYISFKDIDGDWKGLNGHALTPSGTVEMKNTGSDAATITFTKK